MKKLIIAAAMVCTLCIPALAQPVSASVAIGYTPSGITAVQAAQKIANETDTTDFTAMMKKVGFLAFLRR